ASVTVRAEKLMAAVAGFGPVSRLDAEDTKALWAEIRDVLPYADGTARPLWRLSMAPSQAWKLVAGLRLRAGIDAYYDWQGGLVWMRMEADPEAEVLRHGIRTLGGGHATLLRAAPQIRSEISAFEPQAPAVALLSARVRAKLDPHGIFNPGLMTQGVLS
ncbi:MAG: 2-hydroxy-acid oxidase, partial [Allorhizobium sp.]